MPLELRIDNPLAQKAIRTMGKKHVGLLITYSIGGLVSYLLGGFPLVLIFSLIWLEKLILGAFSPIGMIGIELATVSTVLAGLIYGPINGLIFSMVSIPLLRGFRYFLLPVEEPQWPPFLPGPDDMLHSGGALLAGLLGFMPFFWLMVVINIYKTLSWTYAIPYIMDKPWNPFTSIATIIFNLTVGIYIAMQFFALTGIEKAIF